VVYGVTGLGEFRLDDAWTLSSITGLRRWYSDEKFDADGTALYLLQAENYAKSKQASQELRFNYDSGGRLKAFTGVDFYYQEGVQKAPASTNEQTFAKYIVLPTLLQKYGAMLTPTQLAQVQGAVAAGLNPFDQLLGMLNGINTIPVVPFQQG